MKNTIVIACLALSQFLQAQNSSVELRGDFADLGKLGRMQGGESLPTYSSNNVKGTRYLFDNWTAGNVTTIHNETMGDLYLFMFDKQENNLYIKKKDAAQILLADKNMVKSFVINGTRSFVHGAQLAGGEKDKFYEKIAGKEDKYVLYKSIKTKFIKANRQDAERIKSGDFDDEYKDEINYFIATPGKPLQKLKLSENNIAKALPQEDKKISQFFDTHSSEERDEHLFGLLIEELDN